MTRPDRPSPSTARSTSSRSSTSTRRPITLDGHSFAAELHFVHKAADGRTLVVAVLLDAGDENKILAPVLDALPMTRGAVTDVPATLIDVSSLLPARPHYLRYDGSLTTPPCTEGVTWLVALPEAATPHSLSPAQIAKLHAATQPNTSRPTQPLGDRVITELGP